MFNGETYGGNGHMVDMPRLAKRYLHETISLLTSAWTLYCHTRLIRTLLIRHFYLIRRGNLKTLKALSLMLMLNYPLN